ncbi:MAG TPA: serine/threonine protein kinase, partial [Verrucomicrobiales bacterium]|nr:serine/threonine protein kinase [Verrucomicrobiales bacterium]
MSSPFSKEKDIFVEAEGISDPAERQQFVDRACGGDENLRDRIDKLLSAHSENDGFIPVDPNEQTKFSPETAPREGEGSIIGRYKLLQNIGEGGCGVVYMAEQQTPVVRRVALKIIKLGMDTKQVIARFEAERQALAMMDHPNISKVLDAGATDNGRPFFVMELVRGVRITEFCDQQNLDTKERLNLFMDVCSAIQHAHQKGVIHRDIKPSNILVTMHDHKSVPKIIDFGIAKATQQRLTDKTLFTQFHQFIGTPAYMSPEQAQMSGLDVDTRTDIYSLGVLLYELLTGRTPLDAKELTKADYDEMRRRIREEEPIYPSTQLSSMNPADLTTTATRRNTEPARLNRIMRGELDWIVMKALEKNRKRRYETATELALDVQRYLNLEPVKAAAPSSLYRFRKFARRNQAALITAAIILILLTVGSVVSTGLAIKATIAQRNADALAKKSQSAQELAELREKDANEQRNLVLRSSRALRQNLYASDMYQAQHFLRDGNIAKTRELLLKYAVSNQSQE